MKSVPIFALALAIAHGQASAAADADSIAEGGMGGGATTAVAPLNLSEGGWYTAAELGAIATSGNTTGTSVTGKIDARHEMEQWSNEYIVSGFFKQDEFTRADGTKYSQRAAERYSFSAKAAYKLIGAGKRAFVLGSHVNDKFGAYTRYSTFAIGHGSQWFSSPDATLDVELGPGYFSGERASGDSESGVTVRAATRFRWRLSESALFAQNTSVERGTSNVHSLAETSVSTKINGTMQMKAAFTARNDSNVPVGKKNLDTQTSLTLVYSF
jgi:putative salt-induced outer membrane protein YdiY